MKYKLNLKNEKGWLAVGAIILLIGLLGKLFIIVGIIIFLIAGFSLLYKRKIESKKEMSKDE